MTRSNDRARLALLKILEHNPTHGYDLWKNHHDSNLPRDRSALYRLIRSMVAEGLLEGRPNESVVGGAGGAGGGAVRGGRERRILHVTEKGREFLRERERQTVSQILELTFYDLQNTLLQLLDDLWKEGEHNILYYLNEFHSFRDATFFSLVHPFSLRNNINVAVMSRGDVPRKIARGFPNLTFFRDFARPVAGSIDWLFCPDFYVSGPEEVGGLLREFREYLSGGGIFVTFDSFVEVRGFPRQILNYIFNIMGGAVPPIVPRSRRDELRDNISRVFPGCIRFSALDVNVLLASKDPDFAWDELTRKFAIPT
ncbi:MAG: PadR family transcriptional regulator [Promethearchaeota archaeon]